MHVLITGAAGLPGAGLAGRPARDGVLAGRPLGAPTRADLSAPEAPEGFAGRVTRLDLDLAAPDAAARLIAGRPEVIFHLAAIVPGQAEADRTKGWATNLDASRAGLEDGPGVRR